MLLEPFYQQLTAQHVLVTVLLLLPAITPVVVAFVDWLKGKVKRS